MAGKFVTLNDAAQQLGMTPDQLKELRDAGEIHGYRDGASWKFKPEEIERVAAERGGGESDISGIADEDIDDLISLEDSGIDLDAEDDDASSILISDETLGKSEGTGSSTVIGKDEKAEEGEAESEIKLADDESEIQLADSGSQLLAEEDDESDLKLTDEDTPREAESDLQLSDDENLSGEFELSSDEFSLENELGLETEEADLALSDDDDLLLGSEATGDEESEISLGTSDSGINLASPSDSGLSLEAEPDLAADSGSLELPEDDDMIELAGAEALDSDEATQLKQDEEFMLTPTDELMGDESSDSGSQVIALEDSEAFDEDAAALAQDSDAPLFDAEGAEVEPQMQPFQATESGAVAAVGPSLPEAPYSIFNVLGLLFIVVFLGLTGMLLVDVVRNMWSWNGSYSATTSLMEAIIQALGLNN